MPDTVVPARVYTALLTHNHGRDVLAAATEQARGQVLAQWCRSSWDSERARYPQLSEHPPADDSETITEYFEIVEHKHCDLDCAELAPTATDTLGADEVMRALGQLDALVHALSAQRSALARHRITQIEAELPADREPDTVPKGRVAEVEMLVEAMLIAEAEQRRATRPPTPAELEVPEGQEDPHPLRSTAEILEQVRAELPMREFRRRITWSIPALERIIELNDAATHPLAPDQRRVREEITAHATALIAARRAPGGDQDAEPTDVAQVAYLMPVEVLVDLEAGQVHRVVAIDEGVELDPDEGVRCETNLTAIDPVQARRAVAIAEREQAWPAVEFGF